MKTQKKHTGKSYMRIIGMMLCLAVFLFASWNVLDIREEYREANETYEEAAEQFARVEGILPAPESSHAIRVAIDEALKCKETGEEKTIVFGLTGTGYFDMTAYEKYNDGKMSDYIPTDEELAQSLANLPVID